MTDKNSEHYRVVSKYDRQVSRLLSNPCVSRDARRDEVKKASRRCIKPRGLGQFNTDIVAAK